MIPIVQFDPASMAIYYDARLIGTDETEDLSSLIDTIICRRPEEFRTKLAAFDGGDRYGRALQIASAFVHEKRHFQDFVSTNYGAFRFRQFQEIYGNLMTILRIGGDGGRLCLPLEVHADAVRRRVMGLPEPREEIHRIAQNCAHRRKMVQRDRQVFSSRFGSFEIGGESQLEALAYLTQSRFVRHYAGVDGLAEFQANIYDREQFSAKYENFFKLGMMAGITPFRATHDMPELEQRTGLEIDTGLLEFAIFAALQSDHTSQRDDVLEGAIETSYPAERFSAIAFALKQEYTHLCDADEKLNLDECWQAVNDICKKIFGFTVQEQIARDIDMAEQHMAAINTTGDSTVYEISRDFLNLRKKMLRKLEENPIALISTEAFGLAGGANVDPIYITCTSEGEMGDVPEGFSRIMGVDTSTEGGENRPWRKWWWAIARDPESVIPDDQLIQLKAQAHWFSIIDYYAPLTKLILNGRRVRTILGPELLFGEQRLKAELGLELEFYPGFEFPDDEIPIDVLRFLKHTEDLVCDFTSVDIPKGTGTVLSAWAMRRYPELAKHTIQHLGGHDLAYHTFVRDWSPWTVSDEVMQTLRPLMKEELPPK